MYGVIRVENFLLQSACRWQTELPPALGLVDTTASRGVILEANAPAQAQAVRPGITVAQALARCPGIRLLARASAQEAVCQSLLIEAALTASPKVESTSAGVATLDLRMAPAGSGWEAIGERLLATLRGEGIEARIGFAPEADTAALATRTGEGVTLVKEGAAFFAPLPLAVLGPSPALARILHDWGISTIGDFLRLPEQATAERLGPEAMQLRERALGRARRVLQLVRPVEVYREGMELEHRVETTEPLLFLLRRFLESLSARVEAAHRLVVAMELRLPLDGGAVYERELTLPSPTVEVGVLFRVLEGHLETLRLEECPVGVELEVRVTKAGGKQLTLLERGLRDPAGLGFTLARLQAMVGEGRVGTPQPLATHEPGAMRVVPFAENGGEKAGAAQSYGLPLRRFRPPLPAQVRLHGGAPAWLTAADCSGPVEGVAGPYRFSGQWWEAVAWGVEEWDVAVRNHGLLRLARRAEGWSVEGVYDVC